MRPNEIKTIFDYSYSAFELVWNCVMQLSDEQFCKPIEYSSGSIRHHTVHLMSATSRWMLRLQGAPLPAHLVYEDYMTRATTKAKWDELRAETLDYINSLTQDQLDETVHWELPNRGIVADTTRWKILLHVANHAMDHRTQMLAMLNTKFGIETFEQDMIFYLINSK
jgi:uncharacterized damage-inducible protein DinB